MLVSFMFIYIKILPC